MEEIRYDRRALGLAFIEARDDYTEGRSELSTEYNDALRDHRRLLFEGLQQLFGIALGPESLTGTDRAMFMLFNKTARCYAGISTPSSGWLEAGLLVRKLEETGRQEEIYDHMGRIDDLADRSRQLHLDLLDSLLGIMLDERRDDVFTADDLRAVGVNPTPPHESDYRDW
jgi:hypothetical protein